MQSGLKNRTIQSKPLATFRGVVRITLTTGQSKKFFDEMCDLEFRVGEIDLKLSCNNLRIVQV